MAHKIASGLWTEETEDMLRFNVSNRRGVLLDLLRTNELAVALQNRNISLTNRIAALEAEKRQAVLDAAALDWLEENHTLHRKVDILYVVDGYQVTLMHEDGVTNLSPSYEGYNLRAAIHEAIRARSQGEGEGGA